MASVDLIGQRGETVAVTDLGTLQHYVNVRGYSLVTGTYADAVALLSGYTNHPTAPSEAEAVADPSSALGAALRAAYGLPNVAREVLAGAAVAGSQYAVSSLNPTITQTTTATPTIASAVRYVPRRLPDSTIDAATDPNIEFVAFVPGALGYTTSDLIRPRVLTGGTAQNARWPNRWRFVHTGQVFEFIIRALTTSSIYRVSVDGVRLTDDYVTIVSGVGTRYSLKYDFGSVATRTITIELGDVEFGGIYVGPTDTVTRPRRRRALLAGFGDSHTAGANGVGRNNTWVRRTADILNCEWTNLGIGGSGYLNGTVANYRARLDPDVIPTSPDVLVFEGSWNDSASSSSALSDEALYCFSRLKAALPSTVLIAAGPWVTSHTQSTTLDSFDAVLRAAAQTSGWHGYISYRDPLNLKASAAAWAPSTAYSVGNVVVQNGFAQKCIVAHTSGATFDQTSWRSTALVFGTGKVGTTTGDGNADVVIDTDGIHGTALAHQMKAAFIAAQIQRICRAVAAGGGSTWAA